MDEIDKRQQQEIDALKEGHDDQQESIKIGLFIVGFVAVWLIVVSAALVAQTFVKNDVTITIKARQ